MIAQRARERGSMIRVAVLDNLNLKFEVKPNISSISVLFLCTNMISDFVYFLTVSICQNEKIYC